jgi:16S rRNA (cytosine967-C5)-methyltransferase
VELAMEVIRRADREHPADGVLRTVLKGEAGLGREVGAEVARRVFGFYRWLGRIDRGQPLRAQVEATSEMASAFAESPESFSDADLGAVVPEWVKAEVAGGPAWLRSLQLEPRLWLRARPGTGDVLALELGDCSMPDAEGLPDALWYQGTQDLFRTPAFQEGRFELQDLASQAVGWACAPRPGESWWDACAGEGGKTLHLADQMGNRGTVWATDRAAWRLQRLRMRAARAGLFNIRWGAWDGVGRPPVGPGLHGVLVDAPCSGVGTWQRNPQGRWTLTAEDVADLAALQLSLLRQAATRVRPGGMLIYAVCTLTRSETVGVSRRFEAEAAGFEPVAVAPPWRLVPGADNQAGRMNEGWILPEDRGCNGMFMARWRRTAPQRKT